MPKYITKNFKQTQKLGQDLAQEILKYKKNKKAKTLLLYGDLGGGKTTFLQGFAKGLGVKQKVLSPTFVVMKSYKVKSCKVFYHLDCYRLRNEKDAKELGLVEILKNPENIVAIEWPERIKKILPKNVIKIKFKFISTNERAIIV